MTVIEPGRYICVKTSGFVPWMIRAACRSEVDHVMIVVPPGNLVVEAEPQGVMLSPLSKYAGAYARANVAEDLTSGQLAAIAAKAKALIGAGYNFAAIGDDIFEDVLHWHWRWLLRLTAADHRLDCSQLAAYCGRAGGADWLCGRRTYCEVTPADLDRRAGVRQVDISPAPGWKHSSP